MPSSKDDMVFDWDWLQLDKADIEILSFLLLNGERFAGTLSELCRSLGRSGNTRSRNKRQEAIERLCAAGAISRNQLSQRRFEIHLLPTKGEEIRIDRKHLEDIRCRRYDRDVAWQQVLKVYLWLKYGGNTIQYKRNEVAADLGVSPSTITAAIRVLADHYGAISTHRLGSVDSQGNPRCSGQEASLSAFWLNN